MHCWVHWFECIVGYIGLNACVEAGGLSRTNGKDKGDNRQAPQQFLIFTLQELTGKTFLSTPL